MYFNVSQLLKERSGSARTYDIDESLAIADDAQLRRVVGTVNMLKTDMGIWVSARLITDVPCTCSRCVEKFDQPITLAIEEEFFPHVDSNRETNVRREGEEADSPFIDQNHTLDLRGTAREYSALNIPMKPVCRADCAGICLTCGANLNEAECGCEEGPRDSRWGPLLRTAPTGDNDN